MDPEFNDHPMWKFALAVYGAPGVSAGCLDLQERRQVDVNLLLFAAYVGMSGRGRLDGAALAAAAAAVAPWSATVVRPLRAIRRALKQDIGALPAAQAQALRRRVQATEIEAEQLEQKALAATLGPAPADPGAPAAATRRADAAANLEAYLGGCPAPDAAADAAALAPLLARLDQMAADGSSPA